jgi:hypothetical protein
MLIGDSKGGVSGDGKMKIFGFTHILAVNEYTWNKYRKGLISDLDFNSKLIVPKIARHNR